jgi:lysozyme
LDYKSKNSYKFFAEWRKWYQLFFCVLLVMYPNFVSDGQSWKFVKKYNTSIPLNYSLHGIDISRHNGVINWEEVATSEKESSLINFIFIKATEGTDLVDPSFGLNWNSAKEYQFYRGAYHFFVPYSDARLQALNFILNFKYQKGDLVPVLDFEIDAKSNNQRKKMIENVKTWLEIVEQHVGKKPIIYTNRSLYFKYVKNNFNDYPLWISDFKAPDLQGFDNSNVILWQHSDSGKINGIKENVDFNVFLGTPHKLEKYRL